MIFLRKIVEKDIFAFLEICLTEFFQADSEEDLAELEAELYSQIYYEATEQSASSSKSSQFNVSDYVVDDNRQPGGSHEKDEYADETREGQAREKQENIEKRKINNQRDDPDEDEESRYSSLKVLESNPFYSEPESSEDEGIIDCCDVRENEPTNIHVTTVDDNEKEISDLSSESEDDDDDDGIIVLPAPPRDSPRVINLEEEEENSEGEEVLEEVYEVNSRKKLRISKKIKSQDSKNSAKKIQQILGKERNNKYREDYGSDFEDNFLSDGDEEVDDSEISLGNLMGSNDRSRIGGKRKVSELFAAELDEVQAKTVEKPTIWTSGMEKFYNKVDEELMDIDLDKVLGNMSQDPEKWTVDR